MDRPNWKSGRQRRKALPGGLLAGLCLVALAAPGAGAQSLVDRTSLIDVHGGSSLDGMVWSLGTGGYELKYGTPINFAHWYTGAGQNVSATWMTEVQPDIGIYWGFQTGEAGVKYRIQPALNLGVILVSQLSKRSTVSLSGTAIVGGWLKESSCPHTDYGPVGGGIQNANCRLAASSLPAAETLKYLVNTAPPDWLVVSIRYTLRF